MKHIAILIASVLSLTSSSRAEEPLNVELLKEKISNYHSSGQYQKDLEQIASNAKYCIGNQLYDRDKRKKALVLDIDDTSLHLFKHENKLSFGVSPEEFENIVKKSNAMPVTPILNLYRYALSEGIAVFFISGRREILRDATKKNLKKAGYTTWDGLYLRPHGHKHKNSTKFKTFTRNTIRSKGYKIIANIGDQKSDFGKDRVQCQYKLPNPHYFVR